MFHLFARVPLWIMLILGFIYSVSISWNINGISHNFIHNPYFRSPLLNRLFSILESITVGFSQVFYECIHMQHHKGNADRPDENGETVDWISIYKHGHDGDAEHPLKYTFLSFFREDPKTVYRELKRKNPRDAFWGVTELTLFVFHVCHSRRSQLALHLFSRAVLVLWSLPFLPQRLLPPLWRQPGRAACLGGEQLRQALQLDLVLQRLSRRTSFPTEGALDTNAGTPRPDRGTTTRRWCPSDQTAARPCFSRSRPADTQTKFSAKVSRPLESKVCASPARSQLRERLFDRK